MGAICSARRSTEPMAGSRQTMAWLSSRDRLQHRGDQFGVGRQRDVFLGAGADRAHRGRGVGADAAGDHGCVMRSAVERVDQAGDVELHVAS